MEDSLIKQQFGTQSFNFSNFNAYGDQFKTESDQNECKAFLRDIVECVGCGNMVVDCQLEDKIRGFDGDSKSLDKYFPLNSCIKCLE